VKKSAWVRRKEACRTVKIAENQPFARLIKNRFILSLPAKISLSA